MWPFCHFTGVGGWSGWTVAGAVLGTLVPLLFLAAFVALAIVLVRRLGASRPNQTVAPFAPGPSGREIAQSRYARGEITRDEYHALLSHLSTGKAGEP